MSASRHQQDQLRLTQALNRRQFLRSGSLGLGAMALGAMGLEARPATTPAAGLESFVRARAPKARRIIYLLQSGAPSQFELFDWKPGLAKLRGQDLPDSVRQGQRITTMTSGQKSFPIVPSIYSFKRHGESGMEIGETLPYIGKVADDLCLIRSMKTEAINHDPAITFCQTGSQLAGRPSMGAWIAYGLGSSNRDLPTFMVMASRGSGRSAGQPLYDRLWGSGFLPSRYQGVKLRGGVDPVLYLSNPDGCTSELRREMLDDLGKLNAIHHEATGDPEVSTRIAQYELAFRMQTSVPELSDISKEPKSVRELYGPDVERPGSYARNCLLARRMVERGVRFVQLYHMGWDHHDNLPDHLKKQCRDTDQPTAALIMDLKRRGLLEDTVVVWAGEFGRTTYCQGALTETNYGRDHHPRCYSLFVAGGGFKGGLTYGETDDFSYNIVKDPVEVFDLNATILHQMGINHEELTFPFQGRDFRLTDVHGRVVRELLA